MTEKCCGECEYWEFAPCAPGWGVCTAPKPSCVEKTSVVSPSAGQGCPVFEQKEMTCRDCVHHYYAAMGKECCLAPLPAWACDCAEITGKAREIGPDNLDRPDYCRAFVRKTKEDK